MNRKAYLSERPLQRRHFRMVAECFGKWMASEEFTRVTANKLAKNYARVLARENGNLNHETFIEHVMKHYDARVGEWI